MADTPSKVPIFDAIGETALRRYGGHVYEERHPKLSGSQAARIYREMADNSAIIGSVLFTIESLCRQVDWRSEPADESPEAEEVREFLESCRQDMSHTWEELIAEILSMLTYGWHYAETTYKVRRGPAEQDPRFQSRHTDGRIGWRKIATRAQDSLDRWEFDEDGGLRGMHQRPVASGSIVFLPIEKCLLFRPKAPRGNPEGRSLLRNAFRSWRMATRLEEVEGIGIERNLAGLPVFKVPSAWMLPTATADQQTFVNSLKTMGQQIRYDERACAVIPASEETEGGVTVKTGFDFELMSSPGNSREAAADVAIRRHESRIAMTMLAEFLLLGTDKTGSFALASEKTDIFAVALGAILDTIASVFNAFAIPRLMQLNGIPAELWPTLKHGDLERVDLASLATALQALVTAGVLVPDQKLERHVRQIGGLPEPEFVDNAGGADEQEPGVPSTPAPAAAPKAAPAGP